MKPSQIVPGFLIFFAFALFAEINSLRLKHLAVEHGISSNNITCIIQDKPGYMWFGTDDGLNRYDGYSIVVYRYSASDINSLSNSQINCLFEDKRGFLWIGTNSGLNRLDPYTGLFSHFLHDSTDAGSLSCDRVTAILGDSSDTIWVGTANGLNKYDRSTNKFVHYKNRPDEPASISDNYISTLYLDQQNIVWIGTGDIDYQKAGGLNRYDYRRDCFSRYMFQPFHHSSQPFPIGKTNWITSITEDLAGTLWVGTDGGLFRYNRRKDAFVPYETKPFDMTKYFIKSILGDRSGLPMVRPMH